MIAIVQSFKPNNTSVKIAFKSRELLISNLNFVKPRQKIDNKKLRYIPEWFLPKDKTGSYEDFMAKFKQKSRFKSLKRTVRNIIKNSYPIGVGRHSKVYNIPGIDDYVLKVKKDTKLGFFDFVRGLKKTKNEYYGFNFGQAVADALEKANKYAPEIIRKCTEAEITHLQAFDSYINL